MNKWLKMFINLWWLTAELMTIMLSILGLLYLPLVDEIALFYIAYPLVVSYLIRYTIKQRIRNYKDWGDIFDKTRKVNDDVKEKA